MKLIAVFFTEKSVAKKLLKEAQPVIFEGATKPLRLPPETRFAYNVRMLSDVLENQRALKLAVDDPECEEAYDNDEGWRMRDIVGNRDIWTVATAVCKLLEPIAEAIHNIEADRPYLSQCLPLWKALREQLTKRMSGPGMDKLFTFGDVPTTAEDILKVFDNRFKKAKSPLWTAAYYFDPMNLSGQIEIREKSAFNPILIVR